MLHTTPVIAAGCQVNPTLARSVVYPCGGSPNVVGTNNNRFQREKEREREVSWRRARATYRVPVLYLVLLVYPHPKRNSFVRLMGASQTTKKCDLGHTHHPVLLCSRQARIEKDYASL